MMTTIFIISMFAICLQLGAKVFEVKVSKIHFLSKLLEKGDKKIHQLIGRTISKYHHYKKIANIFIFDFLPRFLYEMLVQTKDFVAKKYYEAGNDFRGRRILKSTGSVSFFLEKLSENKSPTDSGKI
ncbi:MAG: hypothetical protein HY507_01450 [Candidatus Zambryskibacteria bacterium]|nr:hypothetical protein [Candidatus Zambryskibacteria bacterium]